MESECLYCRFETETFQSRTDCTPAFNKKDIFLLGQSTIKQIEVFDQAIVLLNIKIANAASLLFMQESDQHTDAIMPS
jgi:hypothetical protein